MALVVCPPVAATFRAACVKPEAFEDILDATIDLVLRRKASYVATVGLSDRATLPILQWDDVCEDAVISLSARALMANRGYNREAGADDEIVRMAEEAKEFVDAMAPGKDGKRVTPLYIDSANNTKIKDGVRVVSSQTSDGWTKRTGTWR